MWTLLNLTNIGFNFHISMGTKIIERGWTLNWKSVYTYTAYCIPLMVEGTLNLLDVVKPTFFGDLLTPYMLLKFPFLPLYFEDSCYSNGLCINSVTLVLSNVLSTTTLYRPTPGEINPNCSIWCSLVTILDTGSLTAKSNYGFFFSPLIL